MFIQLFVECEMYHEIVEISFTNIKLYSLHLVSSVVETDKGGKNKAV